MNLDQVRAKLASKEPLSPEDVAEVQAAINRFGIHAVAQTIESPGTAQAVAPAPAAISEEQAMLNAYGKGQP